MPSIEDLTPLHDPQDSPTEQTWHELVSQVLRATDHPVPLRYLYGVIERNEPRAQGLKYWKAQVRQVLQGSPEFVRVRPGVWDLATRYSPEEVKRFEELRRARYPRRTYYTA